MLAIPLTYIRPFDTREWCWVVFAWHFHGTPLPCIRRLPSQRTRSHACRGVFSTLQISYSRECSGTTISSNILCETSYFCVFHLVIWTELDARVPPVNSFSRKQYFAMRCQSKWLDRKVKCIPWQDGKLCVSWDTWTFYFHLNGVDTKGVCGPLLIYSLCTWLHVLAQYAHFWPVNSSHRRVSSSAYLRTSR